MKTLPLLTLSLIALLGAPVASFAQVTSGELPVVQPTVVQPAFDELTPDEVTAACKNPNITIHNTSSYDITVLSLNFYDGCDSKWRWEELSNVFLPHNYYVQYWHETLSYVQSCELPSFQVKFKWGSNNYWSDSITPSEGSHVECTSTANYDIYLTNSNLF
ncbi:MAG TPA: hypothetical protein VFQ78_14935 [Candidatus Udaeobacter sp.]|jgi:hypothetical protein|nr:hypothetical protein [Candidatus Udaeobacter sp.]